MSTLLRDRHTGHLIDPRITYAFIPFGGESRTFTGEGTKVMLQNSHPDCQIVKLDVQPGVQELPDLDEGVVFDAGGIVVSTANPFDEPAPFIPERIISEMEDAAPQVPMAEFLAMLNLAQVKTVAQRMQIEGRSKMNKGQLVEACDRGQTNTLAGFRSIFGIEV